jgi:hypothetical protein
VECLEGSLQKTLILIWFDKKHGRPILVIDWFDFLDLMVVPDRNLSSVPFSITLFEPSGEVSAWS